MTVLIVCAVRDSALDAFMQPIFVPAIGLATRSFADECNRPDSPMHKHPGDYALYHIGSYDDSSGRLESCEPRQVARGVDVKRPEGVSGA